MPLGPRDSEQGRRRLRNEGERDDGAGAVLLLDRRGVAREQQEVLRLVVHDARRGPPKVGVDPLCGHGTVVAHAPDRALDVLVVTRRVREGVGYEHWGCTGAR